MNTVRATPPAPTSLPRPSFAPREKVSFGTITERPSPPFGTITLPITAKVLSWNSINLAKIIGSGLVERLVWATLLLLALKMMRSSLSLKRFPIKWPILSTASPILSSTATSAPGLTFRGVGNTSKCTLIPA